VLESRSPMNQKDQSWEQRRIFSQVLESQRTVSQGDQESWEQRMTFSQDGLIKKDCDSRRSWIGGEGIP